MSQRHNEIFDRRLFVTYNDVKRRFQNKSVAIVGSGPGVLDRHETPIDDHDIVVRVNNYKFKKHTGKRTDVHYSFYGTSIKKRADHLANDGVYLCMCKLPNQNFIGSDWHKRHGKIAGIDYEAIYNRRKDWWFCDTYIPEVESFKPYMKLVDGFMPTTGFSAILDVLSFGCKEIYLTGFDFFESGIHNVNEKWRYKNPNDPLRHRPDLEKAWVFKNKEKFTLDSRLKKIFEQEH